MYSALVLALYNHRYQVIVKARMRWEVLKRLRGNK